MIDLMLDLETWGKAPGCAIRSIGAATFDLRGGPIGEKFYVNVTDASCVEAGLLMDPETVKWWESQGEVAKSAFTSQPQVPIKEALESFIQFFRKTNSVRVWAQGASYDPPVIEAALRAVGLPTPWKFWDVCDTRTCYLINRFDPRTVKREGTHHNALEDACHQVVLVQAAMARRAPLVST